MNVRLLTSVQNPLVKHVVKLRNDSKYRQEQQSVMIEGLKPVQEVIGQIKKLFVIDTFSDHFKHIPEKWIVSENVMDKMSGMNSSEGVIAEVFLPAFTTFKHQRYILALDGISDPGNLGTLLRTALALGWEGVYLLPHCCDPFNDKAIRSARGAHFRMALGKGSVEDLHRLALDNHIPLLYADVEGISPEKFTKSDGAILILGNEAHGTSQKIRQFGTAITIPMPGEMESLNVAIAGGILMYELKNN